MPARHVDDSLSIRRLNNWQGAVQIQKNGKIQKYQPEGGKRAAGKVAYRIYKI